MRALPLLVLLAACGGGAASAPVANTPAQTDSITLGFEPPKVGDRWSEEQSQEFAMTIDAGGQRVQMTQRKLEQKNVEVLEVTGAAVTKAKYTYVTVQESQEMGGQPDVTASPIAGKTYTLTAGEPTLVTTDAGPASEEEANAVREEEKTFGDQDRMAKMLAGKSFRRDEPVDLPADMVKAAMDKENKMSDASMTLTFRGLEGELAKFDVKLTLAGHDQGNDISFEMTGTVLVDPRNGQPTDMQVSGPFTMSGQFKATGQMTMHGQRTPG